MDGRYDFAARAERVNFLLEEAQRLRVLWQKAENMFASFYAELEHLQPQITDPLLDDWCFWNLGISLETLNRTTKILQDADADRVRASMKLAREVAKQQAAAERARAAAEIAAQQAIEDATRRQREAEEAAETQRVNALAAAQLQRGPRSKVLPELVAEIKRRMLAGEPVRKTELARKFYDDESKAEKTVYAAVEQARGELLAEARLAGVTPAPYSERRPRRRDSRDVLAEVSRQQQATTVPVDTTDSSTTDDLAKAIHAALARVTRGHKAALLGRQEWIEGTLELAARLGQARARFPNNTYFGLWLRGNDLWEDRITKENRAALISMSENLASTRLALENSSTWSWILLNQKLTPEYPRNVSKSVTDDPDASQIVH